MTGKKYSKNKRLEIQLNQLLQRGQHQENRNWTLFGLFNTLSIFLLGLYFSEYLSEEGISALQISVLGLIIQIVFVLVLLRGGTLELKFTRQAAKIEFELFSFKNMEIWKETAIIVKKYLVENKKITWKAAWKKAETMEYSEMIGERKNLSIREYMYFFSGGIAGLWGVLFITSLPF